MCGWRGARAKGGIDKEEKDIQIIDNEPLFKLRKKREASSTAAQGIVDGVDGRWMCVEVGVGVVGCMCVCVCACVCCGCVCM